MDTLSTTPTAKSRVTTIQAKPHAVVVDLATSAVLVIDMQNDFGTEGGMSHRAGIDMSMIQQAVRPTANVLVAARRNGLPIIYLKMAFKAARQRAKATWHEASDRRRLYDQHLRRGNHSRRYVPGLLVCPAGRLHGRTDRPRLSEEQSRRVPPDDSGPAWVDLLFGRVHTVSCSARRYARYGHPPTLSRFLRTTR
jgi:hypothetical protein